MKTVEEIRGELKGACKSAGGQRAWAEANGVSQPYLNLVLSGRQEPGPKIAKALGYRKVSAFSLLQTVAV